MADVRVSKHYELPAQKMWDRIGDPSKLSEWHPAIEKTEMLDDGKRRINTVVGGALVATIRVRDEGEDACSVEWEATFEPVGVPAHEAVDLNRGFFQAGLDAL